MSKSTLTDSYSESACDGRNFRMMNIMSNCWTLILTSELVMNDNDRTPGQLGVTFSTYLLRTMMTVQCGLFTVHNARFCRRSVFGGALGESDKVRRYCEFNMFQRIYENFWLNYWGHIWVPFWKSPEAWLMAFFIRLVFAIYGVFKSFENMGLYENLHEMVLYEISS